ncbi:hypothetical protein [Lysinibacillus pakistanensis]|uniref:hypothetical protein n=1 Tax=Lysinibacillus pakistanensis TaxID=759811 RepID=UPI003D2BE0B5
MDIKSMLFFLVIFITQLMGIIIWGEFLWNFELLSQGATGGTLYDKINPILWFLLVFELVIFITIILVKYGLKQKKS